MIKCPVCGGLLGWAKRKTVWKCSKCNKEYAELNPDTKQFNCSLCGNDLGYPLYSCECWDYLDPSPEYIEEKRKQYMKQEEKTTISKDKIDGRTPIEFFEEYVKPRYCYLASRIQTRSELNKFYPDKELGVIQMYYKEDIDKLFQWAKVYYDEEA